MNRKDDFLAGAEPKVAKSAKFRRRLLIVSLLSVVILAILPGICVLAVLHRPSDYAPQPLGPDQTGEVDHQIDKLMESLYNQVNLMEPFTMGLDARSINRILVLLAQKRSEDSGPDDFIYPQVRLSDGVIELMGRFSYRSFKIVLTVGWEITIDSDVLELSLSSVQLGALPIPKHLFINKLQEIGERVRPGKSLLEVFGGRDRRGQDSADMFADELDGYWLDSLWELAENGSLTLADTFKADVDKFARITDVRISDGRIEFDLLPLAMQ